MDGHEEVWSSLNLLQKQQLTQLVSKGPLQAYETKPDCVKALESKGLCANITLRGQRGYTAATEAGADIVDAWRRSNER